MSLHSKLYIRCIFNHPGREKAIVINLEQIGCIITADEVLLLNSLDSYVLQCVVEHQRRLTTNGAGDVSLFHYCSLGKRKVVERCLDLSKTKTMEGKGISN